MPKKILINAANLHVGGGIQVAVSFIYELVHLTEGDLSRVNILASTEVNDVLSRLSVDTTAFESYRVIDLFGIQAFFSHLNLEVRKYDVVFTVFGPNYLRVQAKKEIVGFAQAWVVDFDNSITQNMNWIVRLRHRMKRSLQWLVFKRADVFIVELEHVKNSLIKKKNINSSFVKVVYNTASSLYFDSARWDDIVIEKEAVDVHLGIISRDYIHKNLSVLPQLAKKLFNEHALRVHFYVTFNNREWANRDQDFKSYVSNVGSLLPIECPSFYEQMDGIIFPSLLECFSATPLEALVMGKPLFASDRDFVRDVCGKYAVYFNPLDTDSMAEAIARYFYSNCDHSKYLDEAKQHAANFSNAKDRAIRYLTIINGD